MSRLRAGILGVGGIAARHAGAIVALSKDVELVACCGRDTERTAAFATKAACRAYTDFRQMLAEQALDLLVVALPPYAHSGQVEMAAAAGIHLLVEKPIALTMDRGDSMVRAARQAGVVAACGFMYRFGEAVKRWDAAAASGEAGRVGMFVGQFHCNALHAPWWREQDKSGGQVVEQLIHIVDLARHQLGTPQTVYARASNFFHRGVERYDSSDNSAIVLGYDDGRVGVLNASNGAIPGRWEKSWQILAEHLTGRFSDWNTATLTWHEGPDIDNLQGQTDVFVAQMQDMVQSIRESRTPHVPLSEGADTLRIVLAAQQSVAEGREIRL